MSVIYDERPRSGVFGLPAVEIATVVMRRGAPLVIRNVTGEATLVRAAEGVDPDGLALLREQSGTEPTLALSAQRTMALGGGHLEGTIVLRPVGEVDAVAFRELADPLAGSCSPVAALSQFEMIEPGACHIAAFKLSKLAGLLPAAVVAMLREPADDLARWTAERGLPLVAVEDVLGYEEQATSALHPVSEAWVPVAHAEDARIIAFRPSTGSPEHLAVIIGQPPSDQPVLTRLHSECFTGDVLGSLRCDCGDQLRHAIVTMAEAGDGVLLYLAQEGRGIGLVNKLRAYALQDRGFDTIDANRLLGFAGDERFYRPAAEMLRQLGFTQVRLMTNNPDKVSALELHGMTVVERVPHAFPSNAHNQAYLRTKAVRSGHYLDAAAGATPARSRRPST